MRTKYSGGEGRRIHAELRRARVAAIVLFLGVAGSIVGNVLAVSGLPSWAFLLAGAGVSLAVAALTLALTEDRYRQPALWMTIVVLAATLAGSWIYDSVGSTAPANFVADKFVPFSLAPGGPSDPNGDGEGLTAGAVNTASCYVTVRGAVWLEFGNDQWLSMADVHTAPGFPSRLPPRC